MGTKMSTRRSTSVELARWEARRTADSEAREGSRDPERAFRSSHFRSSRCERLETGTPFPAQHNQGQTPCVFADAGTPVRPFSRMSLWPCASEGVSMESAAAFQLRWVLDLPNESRRTARPHADSEFIVSPA